MFKIPIEIKQIYDAFEGFAVVSSSYLNLKSLGVRLPVATAKQSFSDQFTVDDILQKLFIRKQVMWEDPNYEDPMWCVNSLKDLRDQCDLLCDTTITKRHNGNDSYRFFSLMLRTWGSYCDIAYKDIVKADLDKAKLPVILSRLRRRTYPIVISLAYGSPSGTTTEQLYLEHLELGMKNSRLTIKQVLPKWTIEL